MTARPVRPFVGKSRPAFVVPPGPADLQIPGGETLPLEADALDEGEGGGIGGLDVRLNPMQREISEGVPEDEHESLGHVTKAGVGNERSEGKQCRTQVAALDARGCSKSSEGHAV